MSAGFKKRQRNPAEEVAEFKSKRGFTQKGVDDLVMLPKITEGEIVENLHKRHSYDAIYVKNNNNNFNSILFYFIFILL